MPTAIAAADLPDEITGPYGTARRVPAGNYRNNLTGLDTWIIDAPEWHPLWTQYVLSLATLADIPGAEPVVKDRPGVTHELVVATLDPSQGPYDASTATNQSLCVLQPINVLEQFAAADDDLARRLARLCARAVTIGILCPETGDAPDLIRAAWRMSIGHTLEHGDDCHHLSGDQPPADPEPSPGNDATCGVITVDDSPVRILSDGELTEDDRRFLPEVIRAARRRYDAEHPTPADTTPAGQ